MKRSFTSVPCMRVKFLVAAMFCGASMFAASQVDAAMSQPHDLPGMPGSSVRYKAAESSKSLKTNQPQHLGKRTDSPRKSDEATVKVRVNFPKSDGDWIMPWGNFKVYNESGFSGEFEPERWDEEGNELVVDHLDIEIPAGTYDFLCPFQKKNPNNLFQLDHVVFNILEQVSVGEGSVVEFKPEECTVRIGMETYNPDGEKTRFRTVRYGEDWSYEILEESNVSSGLAKKLILVNGEVVNDLPASVMALNVEPGPHGEYNSQDDVDFFVNPVSDRYLFRNIIRYGSWPDESKGTYFMVVEARGGKPGVYTNSRNFVFDDFRIASTPVAELYPPVGQSYGDGNEEPPYPYCLDYFPYIGNSQSRFGSGVESVNNDVWKVYTSGPENPMEEDALYFSYSKTLRDAYVVEHMDWGDWIKKSEITAPAFFPLAKDGFIMNVSPVGVLANNPNGTVYPINPFPGNRSFMSLVPNIGIEAAVSAPLFTYVGCKTFNWDTSESDDYLQCCYTGRLNENIGSDFDFAKTALYVKNEKVAEGWGAIAEWVLANQNLEGEYRLEASTDNFKVDGIAGGNTAIVSFTKGGADVIPPSATMLQFRDNEGKICQEFGKGSDATVMLSAADFTCEVTEINEQGYRDVWMVPSVPAKVTATVKPTGVETEAFEEIALTENAEAFDPRGFGALYTGSLADISMTSPTGWFDLTITVEDAAGNSQVQTLSPCFKINALASVGELGTEDYTVRVSGRDIIAPEDSRVYTVSGLPSGMTDLTPGLYLVVTPSGTRKVAIR